MATLEQLSAALIKADAAGNGADAKAFADEIRKMRTAPAAQAAPEAPAASGGFLQGVGNLAAGAVRGAGSIGATLLTPYDLAVGNTKSIGNPERRQSMDDGLQSMGAEPDSWMYKGGKLAGEIAGTAGAGGVVAQGVGRVVPNASALASAISTGGFKAGTATGAAGLATRATGGAVTGGVAAGMVNPEDALLGAAVGGSLPPALMGVGKIGAGIGRTIAGPVVPQAVQDSVTAARGAGYVIPPTQAKPTLVNRLLEGMSGKITTAQNASARNQPVSNELAKTAIGAAELSEAGIAQVRQKANAAYDALGQAGAFQADPAFATALDKAGASTAELRKNFPELINSEIDSLITGLQSRGQFDAQPTIEAIKQFRSSASANKASMDPAKKALGKAQNNIASAFEDLIERNLQQTGQADLLTGYREARKTLAKTYDVEKATNLTSGNVDANKLAGMLKKGRPLTDELLQIAEFGAQFPKAAQTVERMGSLPQTSPLDWVAGGAMSAATANPLMMAGVAARPLARSLVLSGPVQNRLVQGSGNQNALSRLLMSDRFQQLPYRASPVAVSDR